MERFEFFQSPDLRKMQKAVHDWMDKRTADGKKLTVIAWDFQFLAGRYTMTLFYSQAEPAEAVGFK